jgi:hypothetical protein
VTSRTRTVWFWVAIVAATVVVGLAVGPSPNGGPAFDPRSASGNGTKALVLLMQQLGAHVSLTADVPTAAADVTVVFSDQLSADRLKGLADWTQGGGTLIVADPSSSLQLGGSEKVVNGILAVDRVSGSCPPAGLDEVGSIDTGGSLFLRLPPGAVGCFPAGDAYLLVSEHVGRGQIFALGGAGPFTNSLVAKDDNSVLAADLLLPRPGANVDVMLRSPIGGGRRSLWQLLSWPVKLALVQLLVAGIFVALWRARRLGTPVSEVQPVQVAGSELTVAVGNLMARAGRRDAAGGLLRHGLRRWLGERLGTGSSASPAQLAEATAARTTVPYERLVRLLEDGPVLSDAELVELAQSIEGVRQEVAHGPR